MGLNSKTIFISVITLLFALGSCSKDDDIVPNEATLLGDFMGDGSK